MISVYADGSSTGRADRPGGYGWLILRDGVPLFSGYGGAKIATNNTMELEGAIQGLQALISSGIRKDGEPVELVSDSQYCLGIASGQYHPTKNLEQCGKLRNLAKTLGITTRWVRGHTGKEPWNERCDSLARKGRMEYTPLSQRPKQKLTRQEKKARKKKAAKK